MSRATRESLIRDFRAARNGNGGRAVAAREDFARVNGAVPGQGGWRFQAVSL